MVHIAVADHNNLARSFDDLGTIVPVPITNVRRNTWVGFYVNSVETYNAMTAMAMALPNLQQISLSDLTYPNRFGHNYVDGEDADEERVAETADWTMNEIDIISNFTRLRD